MLKTIIILLFTILVVPYVCIHYGQPLNALQKELLYHNVWIALASALICFALSELTGNYSQVDKLWSILPLIYVWNIAWNVQEPRILFMAILVSLWGIRLTYNFSRRGAYKWPFWSGEEDYRWAILRAKPELKGKWRWSLFNLFFISLYQNALILLFTLPIVFAVNSEPLNLEFYDYIFGALCILFIIIEGIADQQQWNYQTEKYRRIRANEVIDPYYAKGFTHTGLWKLVRHPNYTAEQAMWIFFYLIPSISSGQWLNWSICGSLLLMVLFQGSSDFSENITLSKYPDYKMYKDKTGRFLPKF